MRKSIRQKAYFQEKREEFSRLIRERQSNPSYRDKLGRRCHPWDVTETNNRLVALRNTPIGDFLVNAVYINCEQSLFCSKICRASANAICERSCREQLAARWSHVRVRSADFRAKERLLAVYRLHYIIRQRNTIAPSTIIGGWRTVV